MNIAKEALSNHLKRIHCDGLLPDVVLRDRFQGVGASTNRQVMASVGALDIADPFENEVGVTNLGLLIKVIDSMDGDTISVTHEEVALVISGQDTTFRLATAAPRVIGTRIDEGVKTKVLGLVPENADWHPLEGRSVKGVLSAARIIPDVEVLTLEVTDTDTKVIVGNPRLNAAEFIFPGVKWGGSASDPLAKTDYTLKVSTESFLPVLRQLSDFTKAEVCLTGPDSIIAVKEGPYMYVISPDKGEK